MRVLVTGRRDCIGTNTDVHADRRRAGSRSPHRLLPALHLQGRHVLQAPREVVHNLAFSIGRNEKKYRIPEVAEVVAQTVASRRLGYGPDRRIAPVKSLVAGGLLENNLRWRTDDPLCSAAA